MDGRGSDCKHAPRRSACDGATFPRPWAFGVRSSMYDNTSCKISIRAFHFILGGAQGGALGTPSTADGCCSKGSSGSGECLVSLSSCLVTGAGHCPRSSLTFAGSVSGCSTAGSAATGSGERTGHGSVQSGLSVPELDELRGEEGEVTSTFTASNSSASGGVRWANPKSLLLRIARAAVDPRSALGKWVALCRRPFPGFCFCLFFGPLSGKAVSGECGCSRPTH